MGKVMLKETLVASKLVDREMSRCLMFIMD
jgi:hypothetical protein